MADKSCIKSRYTFAVGDHDFCKFSLITSVILLVNIPESQEASWYTGEVIIGIKDAVFEPSSPIKTCYRAISVFNS